MNLNALSPNQIEAVSEINRAMQKQVVFEERDVLEWGYNTTSGNVYCALENGVCIAAPDYRPQQLSFYVYDFETSKEYELDTYSEAKQFMYNLNRETVL